MEEEVDDNDKDDNKEVESDRRKEQNEKKYSQTILLIKLTKGGRSKGSAGRGGGAVQFLIKYLKMLPNHHNIKCRSYTEETGMILLTHRSVTNPSPARYLAAKAKVERIS